MKKDLVRKVFEVEADAETMKTFERFLALLHYNSRFGHSATFAMGLDGDGWDKFTVNPVAKECKNDVDLIGCVGGGLEIARENSYVSKKMVDLSHCYCAKDDKLYKDDKVIKEINREN